MISKNGSPMWAVRPQSWGRLHRWALRAHPIKSKHWVVDRYDGLFNPSRTDRWVFGDRDSGIYPVVGVQVTDDLCPGELSPTGVLQSAIALSGHITMSYVDQARPLLIWV
ncbi:MAG TPA: hypothetical protein VFQ15_05025 [Jiangellaceae bacterium]|nr:hypothetical protein [Jiangellaceae bacterium]